MTERLDKDTRNEKRRKTAKRYARGCFNKAIYIKGNTSHIPPYVIIDVTNPTRFDVRNKDGKPRKRRLVRDQVGSKIHVKLDRCTYDALVETERFGRFAIDANGSIKGRDKVSKRIVSLGMAIAIAKGLQGAKYVRRKHKLALAKDTSTINPSAEKRKLQVPWYDYRDYNLQVSYDDGRKEMLGVYVEEVVQWGDDVLDDLERADCEHAARASSHFKRAT
jgi:hypothetical protein